MLDLKPKTCYGYDNIPVRILLDGVDHLLRPYHQLLNMIYQQKVIPHQWKTSRVIPLHKKGAKNKAENYRPISNLCAGSKIFEKLILSRLMEFDQDIMFTKSQHGFRKCRSTITAGKELQSLLATEMDGGGYVVVASLDLSAAFDVIDVSELVRRMSNMGIPQDIVGLLSAWLRGRTAYVEVETWCSEFYEVENGTVQGSILGPILFNLYMRQLLVITTPICFADDGYYFSASKSKSEAVSQLEAKLQIATEWLTNSGMKVNATKTELTIFHKSLNTSGRIKVDNSWIDSTQDMRVLGITFDSRLDWAKQVDESILKARKSAQALRRLKDYFTDKEKNTLVTSLVFSKMYYGSEIWLLPNLKERYFTRLYSQSGRSLKIVNKNMSYRLLHQTYSRATPKLFSLYQTSINYFDLLHNPTLLLNEQENMQQVTLNDRRNIKQTFVRVNQSRAGLNNITNRLRSISNMLEKRWLNLSRENFMLLCKKHIVQTRLWC